MKIWVITLFPDYFLPLINFGIIGQALRGERGDQVEFKLVQLRHYSPKDYKGVDDSPFGGGPGMIIRADVLKEAFMKGIVEPGNYGLNFREKLHVVFPSPRGKTWDNRDCKVMGKLEKDLVFICGRYEGIDERFIELYVDQEISIGDFVLTGGEIPTMAIIDSFMRFKNGILGNKVSSELESFEDGLLEHPQFTKPKIFDGLEVPEILFSGHHKKIDEFRKNESIRVTKKFRPDLLGKK
jgi:tRNA (guanine37-N1)-methyltransferase